MTRPCFTVLAITQNIWTKAITKIHILNSFETLTQAKAALQYEYDVCLHENCDPLNENDRPKWLDDDHTMLRLTPGNDPNLETTIQIDSDGEFHDANEPFLKYQN